MPFLVSFCTLFSLSLVVIKTNLDALYHLLPHQTEIDGMYMYAPLRHAKYTSKTARQPLCRFIQTSTISAASPGIPDLNVNIYQVRINRKRTFVVRPLGDGRLLHILYYQLLSIQPHSSSLNKQH